MINSARKGWLWLGRRGWVLLLLGLMWMLTAWSVYNMPFPTWRPKALHEYIPAGAREGIWLITGMIAVASAFLRKPGTDRWGFAALILMPAERALSWIGTGLLHFTDYLLTPGIWLCIANAVVWSSVTMLLIVISGWQEAPTVVKVTGSRLT